MRFRTALKDFTSAREEVFLIGKCGSRRLRFSLKWSVEMSQSIVRVENDGKMVYYARRRRRKIARQDVGRLPAGKINHQSEIGYFHDDVRCSPNFWRDFGEISTLVVAVRTSCSNKFEVMSYRIMNEKSCSLGWPRKSAS
jgi:hypothetical protein